MFATCLGSARSHGLSWTASGPWAHRRGAPAQARNDSFPVWVGGHVYYYHSNYGGAQTGVYDYWVPDLSSPPVYFQGSGAGSGQRVWNNARSGYNADPYNCVAVSYSKSYGTPALYLFPYGNSGDNSSALGVVNNNCRSQHNGSC
jgi:hypothetical protein